MAQKRAAVADILDSPAEKRYRDSSSFNNTDMSMPQNPETSSLHPLDFLAPIGSLLDDNHDINVNPNLLGEISNETWCPTNSTTEFLEWYNNQSGDIQYQYGGFPAEVPFRDENQFGQQNAGEEEVCYGMLSDVELHFRWPPENYSPEVTFLENDRSFIAMVLFHRNDFGLIQTKGERSGTKHGLSIAILNKLAFRVLDQIVRSRSSRCEDQDCTRQHIFIKGPSRTNEEKHCGPIRHNVWISLEEWNQKTEEHRQLPPYSRKIVRMKADIVLFGPRSMGDGIAKELGDAQLFVQKPHSGSYPGYYDNPQSMKLPDLDSTDLDTAQVLLMDSLRDRGESQIQAKINADCVITNLAWNIDQFFEQLPTHDYLMKVHIDRNKVRTALLDHQREAVDFIVRRESGEGYPERSLWQHRNLPDGTTCQQHIITGARSKTPEDCLGGILADDMGLGKTLSMLASIVAGIDRAKFFSSGNKNVSNSNGEVRNAKSTLVIAPSELLMDTWAREIERHISPGCISIIKFHGQDRRDSEARLAEHDIILTTNGIVMAEQRRGTGPLHKINWYRLVLDEAHTIRNWSSKQFQTINLIQSHIRWCLTGTPIQNSLDDLGALVRFLKMPIFTEPVLFRKFISSSHSKSSFTQARFENLGLLLRSICLRRNKSILPSSEYQVENRRPEFNPVERQQYRSLELAFDRFLNIAVKSTFASSSSRSVMEALLRLRMFCNNGMYMADKGGSGKQGSFIRPDEMLSFLQQSGEAICAYCTSDITSLDAVEDPVAAHLTACLRLVCGECVQEYRTKFKESTPPSCPICSAQHSMDDHSGKGNEASMSVPKAVTYPSKIVSLLDDVETYYIEAKCVVFSFWKTTLDVVGQAMESRRIKFLRVDGDMTSKARKSALQDFQIGIASRVLLITFSTGAVGLNGLTVANRIHILEPQWNPAVEDQAIGRVLRIDQCRQVVAIRYAMRQSVEELVQSRQFHKLQLARGGFTTQNDRRGAGLDYIQQLHRVFHVSEE